MSDAMDDLSINLIRPRYFEFKEIPSQIANGTKCMPHFKDCIRAIDDTIIDVIIYKENQLCYKGRKETPTVNVLAAYDFDLLFAYVLSGWERLAHDSHIFLDTIGNPTFRVIDVDPNFIPPDASSNVKCISTQEVVRMSTNEMTKVRNDIITS
ncbi:hypothetical protein J1N35_041582 [Gossypium stocksii]|uniref:Uncharacterized protein n=1 Tax=Gossypium stocksii TaxID=47602 RepID=A0A9D3ZJV2_9ROSI|nr:hypothetical protein J1N35_041582 [Gossypium stocksii]